MSHTFPFTQSFNHSFVPLPATHAAAALFVAGAALIGTCWLSASGESVLWMPPSGKAIIISVLSLSFVRGSASPQKASWAERICSGRHVRSVYKANDHTFWANTASSRRLSRFEAQQSTPTTAASLILCVLHRQMLTDVNAGRRRLMFPWTRAALPLAARPGRTDVDLCCLRRRSAFTNERGIFCMFYSMSTSDQPALIEQNKLNVRGLMLLPACPSEFLWA